jgi:hypothetical protein
VRLGDPPEEGPDVMARGMVAAAAMSAVTEAPSRRRSMLTGERRPRYPIPDAHAAKESR